MLNDMEQAAKADMVPVFINDELTMLDRWTLTTMKAMAYDQGEALETVLGQLTVAALADSSSLYGTVQAPN